MAPIHELEVHYRVSTEQGTILEAILHLSNNCEHTVQRMAFTFSSACFTSSLASFTFSSVCAIFCSSFFSIALVSMVWAASGQRFIAEKEICCNPFAQSYSRKKNLSYSSYSCGLLLLQCQFHLLLSRSLLLQSQRQRRQQGDLPPRWNSTRAKQLYQNDVLQHVSRFKAVLKTRSEQTCNLWSNKKLNKLRTLKTLKLLLKQCLCWSFLQGEKLTLQRETFSVLILWVAPTYSSMNLNSWLLNNMKNDQENHGQQLKENESELLEVQEL